MDELVDKINSLQAQNIALMHGMATLLRNLPLDKEKLRKEYDARCAIFQKVMDEQHEMGALDVQRTEFERVGNTMFSAQ